MCDCHLRWFVSWVTLRNEATLCGLPSELKGRQLKGLRDEELHCGLLLLIYIYILYIIISFTYCVLIVMIIMLFIIVFIIYFENCLFLPCYDRVRHLLIWSPSTSSSSSSSSFIFKTSIFHAKLGLDVCPKSEVPPHIPKNSPLGMQTKQFTMSSLTHCSHVFLLRPRPLVPSTTNPLQADTQSSTLLRSRCPNHLNLPRLTTSATQLIPRRLYKSSLCFLSFKDTPHIHLTIIRSVLSRLLRSSAFIAHVSCSIYQDTLDTSTIDPSFDTMHHAQSK